MKDDLRNKLFKAIDGMHFFRRFWIDSVEDYEELVKVTDVKNNLYVYQSKKEFLFNLVQLDLEFKIINYFEELFQSDQVGAL